MAQMTTNCFHCWHTEAEEYTRSQVVHEQVCCHCGDRRKLVVGIRPVFREHGPYAPPRGGLPARALPADTIVSAPGVR